MIKIEQISKITFDKSVGKRIRDLREYQHLTREVLAEYADTSVQFLADIECGRKGMTTYTLYKLSNALHISTDYILKGEISEKDNSRISMMLSTIPENHRKNIEQIIQLYMNGLNL